MVIRSIEQRDIDSYNKVSASSFIWKVDKEVDNKLPDTPSLGAFADDGETLMAQVECEDFKLCFGNGTLGGVGIGGVATKPEYRRNNCVRKLFEHVESISREKGWDIGILYPFSYAYYRKFGYESVGDHIITKIPFKYLSHIERSNSVELLEQHNFDRILALYNKIAPRHNLAYCRNSDKYFNLNPYETCQYTYMWKNASGEERSYASYSVNREASTIEVHEIGFLDRESLLGILGFLRCYDGNQETLSFDKLPTDSPVFSLIDEPGKMDRKLRPTGAVRIYNASAVLERNVYPMSHGSFAIRIEDTYEENAGIYEVEYENGKGNVKKRNDGSFDVSLTVACASRLILGGFSGGFEALRYVSGVEIINENTDFLRAIPARSTCLTERF